VVPSKVPGAIFSSFSSSTYIENNRTIQNKSNQKLRLMKNSNKIYSLDKEASQAPSSVASGGQ